MLQTSTQRRHCRLPNPIPDAHPVIIPETQRQGTILKISLQDVTHNGLQLIVQRGVSQRNFFDRKCCKKNDSNSSWLFSYSSRLTLPAAVLSLPTNLGPTLGKGWEGRECVLTFAFVGFALHIAHAIVLTVTLGGIRAMDWVFAKDN